MFRKLWTVVCIAAMGVFFQSVASAQATLPSDFAPVRPNIPKRTFKLTDFGAAGNGETKDTAAIVKAIDACEAAGGGVVDVPPGQYLTGPFSLASNLELHLEKGSTILFSDNPKDFLPIRGTLQSCISLYDGHDVAITGDGTIDGHGDYFWREFTANRDSGVERPRMIQLTHCSRVLVQGVTLTNSPSFHLVPSQCREVTIDGIHIKAPEFSPNTDGIDPSGFDFLIQGCTFDDGDDCIALKASARYDPNRPSCENFLVTDCKFLHGHGMTVGSESYGGLRNMIVRNSSFDGTEAGIRLKSSRERGGLVENLTFEHLTMNNVKTSILITSYYPKIPSHPEKDQSQPVGERTPEWRHILIDDLTSKHGYTAGQIIGLPEMPVEDLELTNVNISSSRPIEIVNANSVRFVDCQLSSTSGKPIILASTVEGLN